MPKVRDKFGSFDILRWQNKIPSRYSLVLVYVLPPFFLDVSFCGLCISLSYSLLEQIVRKYISVIKKGEEEESRPDRLSGEGGEKPKGAAASISHSPPFQSPSFCFPSYVVLASRRRVANLGSCEGGKCFCPPGPKQRREGGEGIDAAFLLGARPARECCCNWILRVSPSLHRVSM